ncbi:MAG: hypothetical protein C5B54_07065, partial [Acidobacteria bacterium]
MISFSQPYWLLLLIPASYALWRIQQLTFAEGSNAQQRFWFAIRAILLLLIIGALAGFQFRTRIRQNQILFLLDTSDSISSEQRAKAIHFLNESMTRIHEPDHAGIIIFGRNAAVERFPGIPRPLQNLESQVDITATNFENVAHLSEALFASNYQKSVVVLSDGLDNDGSADDAFRGMRKSGISTQAFYLSS